MPYDRELADTVQDLADAEPGIARRRMFGGLAWLVYGNMAVAARGDGDLMVRVGRGDYDALLTEPGARETIMRGRPMRGWITVSRDIGPAELTAWVERGLAYARSLPAK